MPSTNTAPTPEMDDSEPWLGACETNMCSIQWVAEGKGGPPMKVEVATLEPSGDEFYDAIEQEHRDGARLMIEAEYLIFGRFAWRRRESDYAMEVTEIMCETQRGKRFVEAGIDGYARLHDLPRLRDLQKQSKLLDVPRLSAIDKTLMLLPPDTPAGAWEVFDNELVGMFVGEVLPSPWSIIQRLRRLVAIIDASVSFDRRKRAARSCSSRTAPTRVSSTPPRRRGWTSCRWSRP